MDQRSYVVITGAIFLIVAIAHLSRLVLGWDITVAGWSAPHWISIPGLLIPALLSVWGFRLAGRSRPSH